MEAINIPAESNEPLSLPVNSEIINSIKYLVKKIPKLIKSSSITCGDPAVADKILRSIQLLKKAVNKSGLIKNFKELSEESDISVIDSNASSKASATVSGQPKENLSKGILTKRSDLIDTSKTPTATASASTSVCSTKAAGDVPKILNGSILEKYARLFKWMNSFDSEGSESVTIPERDSSKLTEDSEEDDSSIEDLKDSMKCLNLLESYISNDEGEKWEKEVLATDSGLDEQADADFSRLRKTIDFYRNESSEKDVIEMSAKKIEEIEAIMKLANVYFLELSYEASSRMPTELTSFSVEEYREKVIMMEKYLSDIKEFEITLKSVLVACEILTNLSDLANKENKPWGTLTSKVTSCQWNADAQLILVEELNERLIANCKKFFEQNKHDSHLEV